MDQSLVFQINSQAAFALGLPFVRGFGLREVPSSARGSTPFLRGRLRIGGSSNLDSNRQVSNVRMSSGFSLYGRIWLTFPCR
jgi:hypothetical protein